MFPQFKKVNNESGIVLFIVLITAIIMMIYSLGILTQSMNEINYGQQQIDQISSEQWSKGVFWNAYASNFANGNIGVGIGTFMNGRTYNMILNYYGNQMVNVTANYDTF